MVRVAGPKAIRDPRPESGLVQLQFTGLLERLARREAEGPANVLFGLVLALLGFGLLLQAGHAATILTPAEFRADFLSEARDRGLAVLALLLAVRCGITPLVRWLPLAMTASVLALLLVWAPLVGSGANGSNRWLDLGVSVQPSEFARVALIVWVAWYSIRLGERVNDLSGVFRMFLPTLIFAGLIWLQPDKGGACVLFLCAAATMWVGGLDSSRVALPFFALVTGALVLASTADTYSRGRFDMWIGDSYNEQVVEGMHAISASGGLGAGFTGGELRNRGFSYMDSDFVFSLVAEEFGAFGMALVLGLFAALFWFSFRMVLSIPGRFEATAAFGLCVSVAVQALIHVGSTSGLFPPKGMTLPFLSDGGTSAIVSCLALGLAIGAARHSTAADGDTSCNPSNATV